VIQNLVGIERVEQGTQYSRRGSKIGGAEMTNRDDRRQDKGPLGNLGEEHRHGRSGDDSNLGLARSAKILRHIVGSRWV
jgi:hypothetical protein